MKITEVRIKLMENAADRLRGFCSITFDNCFVIRDLKIIDGEDGLFVAMPSRKLTSHCPQCHGKNHLRAKHCNQCGVELKIDEIPHDGEGRAKLYADIAHPVNRQCREMIQKRVIEEFDAETERSQQPGYVPPPYFDINDDTECGSHSYSADVPYRQPKNDTKNHRQDQQPNQPKGPHREQFRRSTQEERDSFGKGIID